MRQEFTKAVRVARVKHATRDGVLYCEGCGVMLKIGQFAFDHDNPDGLTGQPTFENCRVLCTAVCHVAKTRDDKGNIAEAKRREAARLGVRNTPVRKIPYRKAAPVTRDKLPLPPRRHIYGRSAP